MSVMDTIQTGKARLSVIQDRLNTLAAEQETLLTEQAGILGDIAEAQAFLAWQASGASASAVKS